MKLANGRLLIIGCTHIDDYSDYCFRGPHSRIKQYLEYAEEINQLCIDKNIGTVVLNGDTQNKGVNDPFVEHYIKNFLKIVSANGTRQVLHNLGQHDIKRKMKTLNEASSFLNLFPKYTTHVGKGTLIEHNKWVLAFRDWTPTDELDIFWDRSKVYVDAYISHVTNLPPFGQKIDYNAFGMGLFNDIHQQGQYENCINIGTPFYHNRIDEEQRGRGIILDLTIAPHEGYTICDCIDFYSFDPSGKKYLKVQYKDGLNKLKFDNDTNTVYLPTTPESISTSDISTSNIEIKKLSNDSVKELVDKEFQNTELAKIHYKISDSIMSELNPIDLNFTLIDLCIQNFRSIRDYKYEFGKSTVIVGDHGSGKSTFINAIKLAMTFGKIQPSDIYHGESYAEVVLRVKYYDQIYSLCATSGTPAFAINGEWQEIPAKQRKGLAISYLPFLEYLDMFMFAAEDSYLLSSMNDDRKSNIITRLYNIDYLNHLHDKAAEILSGITPSINTLRTKINSLNGEKSALEKQLIGELKSLVELSGEVESLNNEVNKLDNDIVAINVANGLQEELNKYQKDRENWNIYDTQMNEFISNNQASYTKSVEELNYRRSEVERLRQELCELNVTDVNYFNNLKTRQLEALNALDTQEKFELDNVSTKCPTCGVPFTEESITECKSSIIRKYALERDKAIKIIDDLDHTISDINRSNINAKIKIENLQNELGFQTHRVEELEASIREYENLVKSYEGSKATIQSVNQKYDELLIKSKEYSHLFGISTIDLISKRDKLVTNMVTLKGQINVITELEKVVSELNRVNSELAPLESDAVLLNKYLIETSNTSLIYQQLLKIIASKFSNDTFRMSVTSFLYRGSMRLSLMMSRCVDGYWIDYPGLSSAQKCFCDIYFLSNLLSNSGALILDEYFKNVNSSAMISVMSELRNMNVNNLILSSHHDGLVVDGDLLEFELVNGESVINKL